MQKLRSRSLIEILNVTFLAVSPFLFLLLGRLKHIFHFSVNGCVSPNLIVCLWVHLICGTI